MKVNKLFILLRIFFFCNLTLLASDPVRAEFFTFETQPEYEVIDIMSVENPEGLKEIAVFEGDTCVGAINAESLPVQLLAYTSTVNGAKDSNPLTFQLYYGRSMVNTADYQLFDDKSMTYEASLLYSGKNFYSRVKIGKDTQSVTVKRNASLNPCYPNPFNPSTTISWQMPEEGEVEVSIFNIKGQKVKTLCNQRLASGQHQIVWDGKEYGSGVYFVRLQAGNQTLMRKILMMK